MRNIAKYGGPTAAIGITGWRAYPFIGPFWGRVMEFFGGEAAGAIAAQPSWDLVLWGGLLVASLAWFVGVVWSDVFSRRSAVQEWARHKCRLFDADKPIPAHTVRADGVEEYHVKLRLHFVRGAKIAIVRLRFWDTRRPGKIGVIEINPPAHKVTGDQWLLTLATIPKAQPNKVSGYAKWGPPELEERPILLEGSEALCELYVRGKFLHQTHRTFIQMFEPGSGTSGRFCVLGESNNPFER